MNPPDNHPPKQLTSKKRTMTMLVIAVVIIILAMIIAVVLLRSPSTPDKTTHLYGYRYTVVYTTHTPAGNSTHRNQIDSDTWTAFYVPGEPFTMTQPFYNNVSSGKTTVSGITCETPGFSFLNSSLAFPFTIPTALNASTTNNNIMVRLTFSTPTKPYNGPLIYTAISITTR